MRRDDGLIELRGALMALRDCAGPHKRWCDDSRKRDKRKRCWTYVEKDGGRDKIRDDLAEIIRSHYDRPERIADDVDRLLLSDTSTARYPSGRELEGLQARVCLSV